ncbi:glycosyltransferase family 4 protein [Nocardioides marinquilinus]|uniref:Glycosyltransferase family 4 protein n=1 Tax=Nocardioides marinquilinus TaxID=1210400 RepID=A0ABP9PJ86_9ACTN
MNALKVTLVCQWYPPEPVSQPVWIVDALRDQGLDVEVLTGVPNYPTGRVGEGYRARDRRSETIAGTTVHRTPLYPDHGSGSARRILNYVSWAVSSAVLGQRHLRSADAALVYSSPATAALAAMVARRRHGVPYVLLVQDVWPDSIFASGFLPGRTGRLAEALVGRFVDRTYRDAAHVVVISPGMADLLASRGVPRDTITVVPNWIGDIDTVETAGEVDDAPATDLRHDLGLTADDFLLMYAGNHGSAQALDSVIEGFGRLAPGERSHLVLVGDGAEKEPLRALARKVCPDRVHFVEPQPRAAMAGLMAQADAQLVSLARRPLFAVTTPSKLQSVMAAGHPVLVSAEGDAAETVRAADAGVAATPGDPDSLAAAVRALRTLSPDARRRLGRNGRDYYAATMSETIGASRLAATLRRAAGRATDREKEPAT